ncbi:MAG: serine hydrolase domain-containing protein [Bryobacteraceae bacterium]
MLSRTCKLLSFAAVVATAALQSAELPASAASRIDAAVAKALAESGAPSVSIAVVDDGGIAYTKAYGNARLDPATLARPEMRYSIGSVSKQFMAGAILLLVQDGKLTLDDPVGRYLPNLTRAHDITIRELLSHTSGYQDYYPLDYVAPFMQKPVTAGEILRKWAGKDLDFEPGTRWQYSNTNFVAAGLILEKVTGIPLMTFLRDRIFTPLKMTSVIDLAEGTMASTDAAGYTRFALGPARPVTPEGRGWLYAAGELAMTAHDLALWDISLIEHTLLTPATLDVMMTPVRLKNGGSTGYGLGVGIENVAGRAAMQHGGAVSGFVSLNTVWPDDRRAVVVFANMDGSNSTGAITNQVAAALNESGSDLEEARQIFTELQNGRIDRALLSSDANAYFTAQVLADAAASLKPLGKPETFRQTSKSLRGGMVYGHYQIGFPGKSLHLSTFKTPEGKLAQYLIQ